MWVEALDIMMGRVARSGLDLTRIAAISGSAQQHGSVYLNAYAAPALQRLDASRSPVDQLLDIFARGESPIWMDTSTPEECREIADAVGGQDALATRTGSRAFERFTGPQIRKFYKRSRAAYAATVRVHLVSSFLASVLIGRDAPVEPGDGSGMNLMDLTTSDWWREAVDATAPELGSKLPSIAAARSFAGTLSPYWQKRHGLPAARVVVWSGDNPCSMIGTGLVREGRIAISLGTSDTVFGPMKAPRIDVTGTGHVFGAPTGEYMGITVFRNGSLARDRVRSDYGMDWQSFSRALDETPPGRGIFLPWFEPEITPSVATPGARRYALTDIDPAANVRALVEGQMMSMALHSRWMGVTVDAIHATGGAAVNRSILQIMADVFGADVYQIEVANSAALGAALRAAHADLSAADDADWDDVIKELAEPLAESRLPPDRGRHGVYEELIPVYAACEVHALGRGPDPTALVERVKSQSGSFKH
jgi:xylulokinase